MKRLLFAALLGLLPSSALADTLIDNANGLQIGADGKLQRFTALHIDDQGKVVRTLEADDARPAAERQVDAGGRTLLPGLIDAHGHVMGLGLSATQLDLVGTRSLKELQMRLGRYAADNPGSSWILGRGWNQEHWPDKDMPTAADLDAVVSDRPVWLERIDGHASVGNSVAVRIAGIAKETQDPPGGRIERDANGNPTGLFIDTAEGLVARHIPPPSPADLHRAFAKAQEIMLSSGVTAVADMGTSAEGWNVMRHAGEQGRLQVRIMAYAAGTDALNVIAPTGPTPWLYSDCLRLRGVKIYADGALGSRGAWLKRPYADKPDSVGLQFVSMEDLLGFSHESAASGHQIAVHAIGDAANEQVISAFETLSRIYPGDRRWRIEHAQVIDPTDIPRLAPAGIIASVQPIHQVSDRTMAETRLGPERLPGSYAWATIASSGVRLAFGSDFPVEPVNPFLGLSAAVSRQDPIGNPPGGWIPSERLTSEQALDGFTRGAAYAGFAEDRIGSLEPGKWADFILVDRDVSAVDPQELARTQVLETWIAGEKVWERSASSPAEPSI